MSFHPRGRMHGSSFFVAMFLAGSAHAVCGDGDWEDSEQCDDGNQSAGDGCDAECRLSCSTEIDSGLVAHTCGHGTHGPFATRAVQSYPGVIWTTISDPHTYFTLPLSGDPGSNRSAVKYEVAFDGAYAFFLKDPYPLSLYFPTGAEVAVLLEHDVSCGGTDALTWVKVYQLTAGTYDVVFGPIMEPTVSLAIESMGSFRRALYWDRDGDGRGGDVAGATWCAFDSNGPATVSSSNDCDDDDPSTYPGAPELCDGRDNACSGGKDVGSEHLCDEDGAGAVCLDDGPAIRCGCARDADCGGEARCDVVEQRCETASGNGGTGSGTAGEGGKGEDGGAAGELGVPMDAGGTDAGRGGRGQAGEPSTAAGDAGASAETGDAGASAGESSGTGAAPAGGRAGGVSGNRDRQSSDSGCGCRMAPATPPSAGIGLLGGVFLVLLRRSRR